MSKRNLPAFFLSYSSLVPSRPPPSRLTQSARALHPHESRRQYSAAHHANRSIKTVAVAGITGAIGLPVIHAVAASGFRVQALTRHPSSAAAFSLPLTATLLETDYADSRSLRHTLSGQDAVISCLGDTPSAVAAQRALIHASVEAGVKRFIPSEFGSDTLNPFVRGLPFFKDKIEHQGLLRDATSSAPGFSWTVLVTGPFLDWGLNVVPFILDIGSRSAEIIDGGNVPFSTTRTPAVAQALAAILAQPEETRNKALYIHEAVVTQNQLLARAVRHLNLRDTDPRNPSKSLPLFGHRDGSNPSSPELEHRFTLTRSRSPELLARLRAVHATPGANPLAWIVPSVNLSFWAEGAPCYFLPGRTSNALLGVQSHVGQARAERIVDGEIERAGEVFLGSRGDQGRERTKDAESERGKEAMEYGKRKLVGCG